MINYFKICVVAFFVFAIVKGYKETKRVQKECTINFALFSRVWLFFAAVLTVGYLFSGFLMTRVERKKIIDIVLLAFMILLYIISVLFCNWYIDIDDVKIECRSLSGKISSCCFAQITKVEIDEKNNICIYTGAKKVLKIPTETGQEYFTMILKSHGIEITYKYKTDDFVMRLPVFYPVMYLCFFVMTGLLAVFLHEYYSIAGWFCLVMALASAFKSMSDFYDRVIIKNNMIVQKRFLRKSRRIECGQILRAVHQMKDKAPYYYLYSEKGLELKISMLCENRELFKEFMKRWDWGNGKG